MLSGLFHASQVDVISFGIMVTQVKRADAGHHGLMNYPYLQSRFLYHAGSFSQPYILQAKRLIQKIKYFRHFSAFF